MTDAHTIHVVFSAARTIDNGDKEEAEKLLKKANITPDQDLSDCPEYDLVRLRNTIPGWESVPTGKLPSLRTATMAELDLIGVPVPFTPLFMAKDEDGGWYVFDSRPVFENGHWDNGPGDSYEIGVYENDEPTALLAICRQLPAADSLFSIIDA